MSSKNRKRTAEEQALWDQVLKLKSAESSIISKRDASLVRLQALDPMGHDFEIAEVAREHIRLCREYERARGVRKEHEQQYVEMRRRDA